MVVVLHGCYQSSTVCFKYVNPVCCNSISIFVSWMEHDNLLYWNFKHCSYRYGYDFCNQFVCRNSSYLQSGKTVINCSGQALLKDHPWLKDASAWMLLKLSIPNHNSWHGQRWHKTPLIWCRIWPWDVSHVNFMNEDGPAWIDMFLQGNILPLLNYWQ